jgi:aminoglycoside 6'-N-acetyltransferase I
MDGGLTIERCNSTQQTGWLDLRHALWPDCPPSDHSKDMAATVAAPTAKAAFIAYDKLGHPQGFVEAALRHDHVNGTTTSPVAFLEGVYVAVEYRRQGIARQLVSTAEEWALSVGCTEFASDALLENAQSHAMHAALGFQETERVIYFKKVLARSRSPSR